MHSNEASSELEPPSNGDNPASPIKRLDQLPKVRQELKYVSSSFVYYSTLAIFRSFWQGQIK